MRPPKLISNRQLYFLNPLNFRQNLQIILKDTGRSQNKVGTLAQKSRYSRRPVNLSQIN